MLKQIWIALGNRNAVGKPSPYKTHPLNVAGRMACDQKKCVGCWQCVKVCPVQALRNENVPESWLVFYPERCIGCAQCLEACSPGALSFSSVGIYLPAPHFQPVRLKQIAKQGGETP